MKTRAITASVKAVSVMETPEVKEISEITMELEKTDFSLLPESERSILFLAGVRFLMASGEALRGIFEPIIRPSGFQEQYYELLQKVHTDEKWKS